ncbi:hypothetical protein L1887_18510 [Cichorium endivia]|nr:hypothetical protein L1887_18510 [Cichorium endivia]
MLKNEKLWTENEPRLNIPSFFQCNSNSAVGESSSGVAHKSGKGMEFVFGKTNPTMLKENGERIDAISKIEIEKGRSNYVKKIFLSAGSVKIDPQDVTGGVLDHRDEDYGYTTFDDLVQALKSGSGKDGFFNSNRNSMSTQVNLNTKMDFPKAVSGSSISKSLKARYIKPQIDKQVGAAMIPIDVVQRGGALFSHMLYGYFVGEGPAHDDSEHNLLTQEVDENGFQQVRKKPQQKGTMGSQGSNAKNKSGAQSCINVRGTRPVAMKGQEGDWKNQTYKQGKEKAPMVNKPTVHQSARMMKVGLVDDVRLFIDSGGRIWMESKEDVVMVPS